MNEENDKIRFREVLLSTQRKGMETVLDNLEKLGFFEAPASTKFHGSMPGGLLKHSLGVYDEALALREVQIRMKPEMEESLPLDSIAVAALLHDVCKAEIYKEVEKWRKDGNNQWQKYTVYGVDYAGLPVGHGEKSVIRLLRWGLELTDWEIMAIRWHMSAFDLGFQSPEARGNYGEATNSCPLLAVIKAADSLASHILGV